MRKFGAKAELLTPAKNQPVAVPARKNHRPVWSFTPARQRTNAGIEAGLVDDQALINLATVVLTQPGQHQKRFGGVHPGNQTTLSLFKKAERNRTSLDEPWIGGFGSNRSAGEFFVFSYVQQRTFTRDQFEFFIETGKVIKPTFEADLLDSHRIIDQ
jgi:hypothetical protein